MKNDTIFQYVKELIKRYKYDDVAGISAQITYYLILAFFPFLLFLINLLSFTPLSSEILVSNFNTFLPNETGTLVQSVLEETLKARSETLLIVGILGSLWSSSRGLTAIRKGLNTAYNVKESRNFFILTFMAILSVIGLTIIIILSFVLIVLGEVIGRYIFSLLGVNSFFSTIWTLFRYLIPLVVMFITFTLLYKYVPNKKMNFHTISIGALFSTIGCMITSFLFSFYVNHFSSYEKVYGSLGGIIALIIWLYIIALIIIVGGEIISIRMYLHNKKLGTINPGNPGTKKLGTHLNVSPTENTDHTESKTI